MFCERLRSIALTLRHTLYQDDKGSLSVSLSLSKAGREEREEGSEVMRAVEEASVAGN